MTSARHRIPGPLFLLAVILGAVVAASAAGVLSLLVGGLDAGARCASGAAGPAGSIVLGPAGSGQRVGASEYGGPGDPSSGSVGASGQSLIQHPDSYAELGGYTFQTAVAMGGLPYMAPLRVSWGGHSAIAYKRDFGLGGGSIDGLPRVVDLWWQFAGRLGIPYEQGLWSGPVQVDRPPASGAGNLLGQVPGQPQALPGQPQALTSAPAAAQDHSACAPQTVAGVPITAGQRAQLLADGQAAAPAGAPVSIRAMIAAGNQIAGKPYVYGGGHGLPLDQIAPAYDCSSSVEHLLYGAGLLPVSYGAPSSALESFGLPGPGRWVTLYASAAHVFMYVAGLRWDTHGPAGPGDGSSGIGWHPLIRAAAGFVARHPVGL